MKLIVGLGNPGYEYNNTRHNVGFMFLDYINCGNFQYNSKMNSLECVSFLCNEKVIFIKPLSYMNLSGDVVLKYAKFYKISAKDIFVIQDDLDMKLGSFKLMYNHNSGGHNGIKDIIRALNSKEFLRLKIGISNNKSMDTKDYVLGKFNNLELESLENVFNNLKNIFEDYVSLNLDKLIMKYNSK